MIYFIIALKITLFLTSTCAIIVMIDVGDMTYFPLAFGIILCGIYDIVTAKNDILDDYYPTTYNNYNSYNQTNNHTTSSYSSNNLYPTSKETKDANNLIKKGIKITFKKDNKK